MFHLLTHNWPLLVTRGLWPRGSEEGPEILFSTTSWLILMEFRVDLLLRRLSCGLEKFKVNRKESAVVWGADCPRAPTGRPWAEPHPGSTFQPAPGTGLSHPQGGHLFQIGSWWASGSPVAGPAMWLQPHVTRYQASSTTAAPKRFSYLIFNLHYFAWRIPLEVRMSQNIFCGMLSCVIHIIQSHTWAYGHTNLRRAYSIACWRSTATLAYPSLW